MFQQAQGDLLFERIENVKRPKDAKRMERDARGRIVLAVSEVKGHTHAIYDPGVVAWMLDNGNMMLEVEKASPENPVLVLGGTDQAHSARMDSGLGQEPFPGEGHLPIRITEPGMYTVVRQREFDAWAGWRQAAD